MPSELIIQTSSIYSTKRGNNACDDKVLFCFLFFFCFINQTIAVEFKKESVASICKAISKHIEHAQGLKEANNAYWWKYYESCLLAINSFKDTISELSAKNALEFDLNAFINQVVISSLYETSEYP